jgi:uncharacterized protein YneF (UPF0154 family)
MVKSGVSMNTILIMLYLGIIFGLGTLTGIYIEYKYQQQLRSKFRAMHGPTIEQRMFDEGWRI